MCDKDDTLNSICILLYASYYCTHALDYRKTDNLYVSKTIRRRLLLMRVWRCLNCLVFKYCHAALLSVAHATFFWSRPLASRIKNVGRKIPLKNRICDVTLVLRENLLMVPASHRPTDQAFSIKTKYCTCPNIVASQKSEEIDSIICTMCLIRSYTVRPLYKYLVFFFLWTGNFNRIRVGEHDKHGNTYL